MATLTFVRPRFVGRGVPIEVFVDQKPYGRVVADPGVEVPVSPGSHHIELRATNGKATTGTIQASPGNTVLKVGLSTFGAPKFGIDQ
jgi:hypothetical protein